MDHNANKKQDFWDFAVSNPYSYYAILCCASGLAYLIGSDGGKAKPQVIISWFTLAVMLFALADFFLLLYQKDTDQFFKRIRYILLGLGFAGGTFFCYVVGFDWGTTCTDIFTFVGYFFTAATLFIRDYLKHSPKTSPLTIHSQSDEENVEGGA